MSLKSTPLTAALAIRAIIELALGERLAREKDKRFSVWYQDLGHDTQGTVARVFDIEPDTDVVEERLILRKMNELLPTFKEEFHRKVQSGDPYILALQRAYPVPPPNRA